MVINTIQKTLNCDKCGRFMAKDGNEWMQSIYYVNQNWKCGCGNTRIKSRDIRPPIRWIKIPI